MFMDSNYGAGSGVGFRPGAPMLGGPQPTMGQGRMTIDPRHLPIIRALLMHGIRSFAQGGIVTDPTLAVVGDNGPEAMVPLGAPPSIPGGFAGDMAAQVRNPAWQAQANTYRQNSPQGIISRLLSGARNALSPDYLRTALRRSALTTASSARRRAATGARLYGLDPMQARQAQVQGDIGASGDLSNALNSADLQGLTGYQDLIRSLLTGERGYQFNAQQNALNRQAAKDAANHGLLGQLGGAAVGALIPGGRG